MKKTKGMYFWNYKLLKPGRFSGHVLSDEEWSGLQACGAGQLLSNPSHLALQSVKVTPDADVQATGGIPTHAQTTSASKSPVASSCLDSAPTAGSPLCASQNHPLHRSTLSSGRNPQQEGGRS